MRSVSLEELVVVVGGVDPDLDEAGLDTDEAGLDEAGGAEGEK